MSHWLPLLHPIQSGLVLFLGCRCVSCYCAAVMHWPFVIVTAVHHPHDDAGHHGDHDEQKQGGAHDSNDHGRVAGRKWFCKTHTTGTKHRDLKKIHCKAVTHLLHLLRFCHTQQLLSRSRTCSTSTANSFSLTVRLGGKTRWKWWERKFKMQKLFN